MSIGKRIKHNWTEDEDKFLIDNYPNHGRKHCADVLNKNCCQIANRIRKLKLVSNSLWKEFEIQFIKDNYKQYGYAWCAKRLDRSELSVIQKATKLNIRQIESWSEEEDKIIKKYYPDYGKEHCSKLLNNRTPESCKSRASKLGVSLLHATEKMERDYKEEIIDSYVNKHLAASNIANMLGFTNKGLVIKLLKKWNIPVYDTGYWKRYQYDKNFFAKIDSHEKAYWLGFLYADGNIHKNRVQFSSIDKCFAIAFKRALKSKNKIREYTPKNPPNSSTCYAFGISDPKIVIQLNNLGMFPKKSLNLEFPSCEMVPEKFLCSFMLGYFDGDGCVQRYKPKKCKNYKWSFGIISTYEFCKKYQEVLMKHCKINETKLAKYKRILDKNIWEIHYCGVYKDRLQSIVDFLYSGKTFYLPRKRKIFDKILKSNPVEPYFSKYYGVRFDKRTKKIFSSIISNGKQFWLGYFENDIDAAKAYDNKAKELYGNNYSRLNFPNE